MISSFVMDEEFALNRDTVLSFLRPPRYVFVAEHLQHSWGKNGCPASDPEYGLPATNYIMAGPVKPFRTRHSRPITHNHFLHMFILIPSQASPYRFASPFLKCGIALMGLAGKASVSLLGSGSRCEGFCTERERRYEDSRRSCARSDSCWWDY
jgi:hypothetical protein